MDDAALVRDAVGGSRDAFAAIYDRYAGRLHDFLWWVLGDAGEATDALGATFRAAGSRIHQLDQSSQLRPWLFAIARHVALEGQRRPTASPAGSVALAAATLAGAGEATAQHELAGIMREAAAELSARDRVVLDLRLRQHLDLDEVGAAIGASAADARALVDRLDSDVEQSIGLLTVARLGYRGCPVLEGITARWDGELTAAWRKRIERHAEDCLACNGLSRTPMGASALLAAAPALGLAPEARDAILGSVDLGSHTGRPWRGPPEGFPPPMESEPRRRWAVLAVPAALVLVAVLIVALLSRGDGPSQEVASGGGPTTSASSTTRAQARLSTTVGPSTTVNPTATTAGAAGPTSSSGPTTASVASPGTTASPGPATTGPEEPASTTSTAPTTTRPTTTTNPPDTAGPVISGVVISPSVVSTGGSCANPDPRQATVTAKVVDASAIAKVEVIVAGPGSGRTPMGGGANGVYTAVVGPFDSSLPPGSDFPAQVLVQATDAAGNSTLQRGGEVTLRCQAPRS